MAVREIRRVVDVELPVVLRVGEVARQRDRIGEEPRGAHGGVHHARPRGRPRLSLPPDVEPHAARLHGRAGKIVRVPAAGAGLQVAQVAHRQPGRTLVVERHDDVRRVARARVQIDLEREARVAAAEELTHPALRAGRVGRDENGEGESERSEPRSRRVSMHVFSPDGHGSSAVVAD